MVHGCLEPLCRGAACAVVVAGRRVAVDVLVEQLLGLGFDVDGACAVLPYLVGDHAGEVVVADLVIDLQVNDGADDLGEVVLVQIEVELDLSDLGCGVDVHAVAPCWVRVTSWG